MVYGMSAVTCGENPARKPAAGGPGRHEAGDWETALPQHAGQHLPDS
jgi:hypothetical protein